MDKDKYLHLLEVLTHIEETGAFPIGGTDAEVLVEAAKRYAEWLTGNNSYS